MIVSGGTSTGKTTFLNMLLSLIPMEERIGILEDTRELTPRQENVFSLLASKGEQGQAAVTMNQLLEAVLRLRPDRIFMGELRGSEAFAFLNAINTGHPDQSPPSMPIRRSPPMTASRPWCCRAGSICGAKTSSPMSARSFRSWCN